MPRPLKVYSWQGFRPEAPGTHRQTYEVVAARSAAEAARLAGKKRPSALFNFDETGWEPAVEAAMAHPGVVLWCGLDERRDVTWRRADTGQPVDALTYEVGQQVIVLDPDYEPWRGTITAIPDRDGRVYVVDGPHVDSRVMQAVIAEDDADRYLRPAVADIEAVARDAEAAE